jgi:hypothetical protein
LWVGTNYASTSPLCHHRHVIRWLLPLPSPNTMLLLYQFRHCMISNAAHAFS